ncbi:MAG: hypothetical protein CM15mP120_01690 [Pseudomonadota bacterium]|nr:MAG: hypothetical protein CM15mP120_01690 [Pseudomonadota bacterium]
MNGPSSSQPQSALNQHAAAPTLKLQPHAQGIGGVCLFTACRWIGFVIEVGAQGRIYSIAEGKTNSGT